MDIIRAEKQDLRDIINIIFKCIEFMENQRIYQWDEFYPNSDILENDIDNKGGYIVKQGRESVAYVAIDQEQPPEYTEINWFTNGRKVLVIHRLAVHPEFQQKGIAKQILKFIENFAKKNDYSCIRLDAYSENIKALKLYEGLAYKKVGQLYFPRREFPFYCYEKNILNS